MTDEYLNRNKEESKMQFCDWVQKWISILFLLEVSLGVLLYTTNSSFWCTAIIGITVTITFYFYVVSKYKKNICFAWILIIICAFIMNILSFGINNKRNGVWKLQRYESSYVVECAEKSPESWANNRGVALILLYDTISGKEAVVNRQERSKNLIKDINEGMCPSQITVDESLDVSDEELSFMSEKMNVIKIQEEIFHIYFYISDSLKSADKIYFCYLERDDEECIVVITEKDYNLLKEQKI